MRRALLVGEFTKPADPRPDSGSPLLRADPAAASSRRSSVRPSSSSAASRPPRDLAAGGPGVQHPSSLQGGCLEGAQASDSRPDLVLAGNPTRSRDASTTLELWSGQPDGAFAP